MKKPESASSILHELSLLAKAVAATAKEAGRNLEVDKLTKETLARVRDNFEQVARKTKESAAFHEAKVRAKTLVGRGREEGEKVLRDSRSTLVKGLKKASRELNGLAARIDKKK